MSVNNWQKIKLGDLCEFSYGKGLPGRSRVAGDVPVYGSNGIVGFHNEALLNNPSIIEPVAQVS